MVEVVGETADAEAFDDVVVEGVVAMAGVHEQEGWSIAALRDAAIL